MYVTRWLMAKAELTLLFYISRKVKV